MAQTRSNSDVTGGGGLDGYDANTDARNFIGISGTDATASRIDTVRSPRRIFYLIQQPMIGHHHMSTPGHKHIAGGNAVLFECLDLFQEGEWIDDRAGSQHTEAVGIENTTGHQMQLKFAELIHNRMTGIAAPLETHTEVSIAAQKIDQFPLPLITPLLRK